MLSPRRRRGRDQLGFRSYYFPVKDVIDGDLCETYTALDPARRVRPPPPLPGYVPPSLPASTHASARHSLDCVVT